MAAVEGLADVDAVPGPHNARAGRWNKAGRALPVSTSADIARFGGFTLHGQVTGSFSPFCNVPCGVQ
jgi:hypothetical protein